MPRGDAGGGGGGGGSLDWTSVRNDTASMGNGSGGGRSRRGGGGGAGSDSPKPRKLCVGAGEADGVTFAALRAKFEAFGSIERVDMPANKTYSFVEFAERAAASRAYAATNNEPMFGKGSVPVSYARSKTGDAPVDVSSPKLWVSGLAKGTRKAEIERIFGGFGHVTRVDAPSGKDYAFVWFERVEDSEMAKRALHNQPINGQIVRITYSNKVDGAPPGRPKPATVTRGSPIRQASPAPERDRLLPRTPDARTPVSADVSPHRSAAPVTWSSVLGKAKQSPLAAVVAFASSWSLWYDDPTQHGAPPSVLGTFSDPSEFFDVVGKRVPRVLRGGSRLLLLRAGAPPSPRVVSDGGQIIVHTPRNDAPSAWFRLMEIIMLEDLSFKETLPGVVLERTDGGQQGGTDSLVIWTNGLVDQVGVQTTQLAIAELRSALKLRSDIRVTHQAHETATPTSAKGILSSLAGGDPWWALCSCCRRQRWALEPAQ
jgi:hypothetical protein